jgi:WD40 repeat protein
VAPLWQAEVKANDWYQNGELTLVTGADGVKVWELKTGKEINLPQQPYHERAQVSSVCWVTRKNETFDTLCYGNALGFLVFLQHRPTEVSHELTTFSTSSLLTKIPVPIRNHLFISDCQGG